MLYFSVYFQKGESICKLKRKDRVPNEADCEMDLDLVCEAEAEATGPLISGGHKKCTLARMTKRDGGGSKDPYRSGLVKCWACSRHTHVNPKNPGNLCSFASKAICHPCLKCRRFHKFVTLF